MHNRQDRNHMALKQLLRISSLAGYAVLALATAHQAMAEEESFQARIEPAVVTLDSAVSALPIKGPHAHGVATAEFVSETATELEVASNERDRAEKRGKVMVW